MTTHYTAHVSLEIDEHLRIPLSLYRSLQLNIFLISSTVSDTGDSPIPAHQLRQQAAPAGLGRGVS